MIGEQTIKILDEQLERNLKQELRDQGHYLTGRLENSIAPQTEVNKNGVSLDITAEDYIDDVNEGIPGNHIDVTDLTYIRGLAEYAKKRFGILNEKEALTAAFRIARRHRKEGMPTRNSYQFSKTGERTQAIEISYDSHARENENLIESSFDKELDNLIDKTFDQMIF